MPQSIEERRASNAACMRRWRANNKEKAAAASKANHAKRRQKDLDGMRAAVSRNTAAWRARNPELVKELRAAHHAKDPKARRRYGMKHHYGLTYEEYEAMLEAQGFCCAVCGTSETKKDWHIDHCHTTGEVRGLLCNNCNAGIGMFKDDPTRLRAAADYLERRTRDTAEGQ